VFNVARLGPQKKMKFSLLVPLAAGLSRKKIAERYNIGELKKRFFKMGPGNENALKEMEDC